MRTKVLLIDDKLELLKLMKLFLSRNYNVESADNGLQAITKLHSGYVPDIIISDLYMPFVDGRSFVSQVRVSTHFRDIPIIILTSNDNIKDRIDLLKLGANDYIVKPIKPEELEMLIQKFTSVKGVA
jgi:DNA-binding response OmpR family regulator